MRAAHGVEDCRDTIAESFPLSESRFWAPDLTGKSALSLSMPTFANVRFAGNEGHF
jgi:hypothetical protein